MNDFLFSTFGTPQNLWHIQDTKSSKTGFPRCRQSVDESNKTLHIELIIAPFTSENVEVSVNSQNNSDYHTLVVSGKSVAVNSLDNRKLLSNEWHNSSFTKMFDLPKSFDVSNIKVSYKNGILDIMVPYVSAKTEPVKIPIHVV